jgi:uroporphyrinogen decarboxylase
LKPERKDWERFKKYLNPDDPSRVFPEFEARAKSLASREHMTCFLGGSLFGWMFNWLGLEAVSCLPYDDPALYEEIISYMADYFMRLNSKFLGKVNFDFAYFFEDCCFNTGPMISPDIYRRFYDRHYRRMFEFYRSKGVKWMLVDSDGKVDDLIPCWLDSGFDIVFPIEIGAWKADPRELRKKYGRSLRMMGGVNKHVIAKGEGAVRSELEALRPLAEEGGFVPMPDHRIPPEVSLGQMRIYADIFRETFKFEAKS